MKNIVAQISISLICVVLGFMISLQLKSVRKNYTIDNSRFQRAEALQQELSNEREKNENLFQQVLQNEKDLNAYEKQFSEKDVFLSTVMNRLEKAEILAGMTDVEGSGIIVTLNDSKVSNDKNVKVDENYFIIHDEDILMVLNELADAEAEALSLNDERIIATSEIRCAGTTVSINNNRYSPPFLIKAIGDPNKLEASLNLRGGVVDILRQWGIEVSIKKVDKVLISRYNGYVTFKHAVPVKKGGEGN